LKNNVNSNIDEKHYVPRTLIVDAGRFLKAIYKKQSFRCSVCNQALFEEEENYINQRKIGGQYSLNNRAILHRTCHEAITYTKNPGNLFPGRT
jgi:hypothetical protein